MVRSEPQVRRITDCLGTNLGGVRRRRLSGAIAALVVAALCCTTLSASPPALPALETWTNVTAGEQITLHFPMRPNVAAGQIVGWSVAVDEAVILRRETATRGEANRPPVLTVQFQLPDGEPNTVVPVSVLVNIGGRETLARRLWIYPADPFQQPIPHLGTDQLVLFDPSRDTAARWEQTPLKFRWEPNIEALAELRRGTLVIGEGVSFREYRGLPELIRTAGLRGLQVLCLSPTAGTIALSSSESNKSRGQTAECELVSLSLARTNILKDFDKHLDVLDWRGSSPLGDAGSQLVSNANEMFVTLTDDPGGWPWLEAEYSGGGRIVVCGFRCIEQWDAGPAPRHALWHILAHTARAIPVADSP